MAIMAVEALLHQKRILYATPTQEQIDSFWTSAVEALMPMIMAQAIDKNETRHTLTYGAGRIRARTAWDQDSLRGDAADLLILDEFQLMHEDAWTRVGAPIQPMESASPPMSCNAMSAGM